VPEPDDTGMTGPEPASDPVDTRKPPNEELRAWGWHVVSWAVCVGALTLVVYGGVLAVQTFGEPLGILAMLVLAVPALATGTWLIAGRTRP